MFAPKSLLLLLYKFLLAPKFVLIRRRRQVLLTALVHYRVNPKLEFCARLAPLA